MSEWDVIRANTAAARCFLKQWQNCLTRIKTMGVSCDSAWNSNSFSDPGADNDCKEPCYGFKNDIPKWKICLVTVLCRSPKLITILQSVLEQLFSLITKWCICLHLEDDGGASSTWTEWNLPSADLESFASVNTISEMSCNVFPNQPKLNLRKWPTSPFLVGDLFYK